MTTDELLAEVDTHLEKHKVEGVGEHHSIMRRLAAELRQRIEREQHDQTGLNLLRLIVQGGNVLRDFDIFACDSAHHDISCQCFWEQCETWAQADALPPPPETKQ